ncbi:glucan biosynthesis protein G [Verticiella sediminum]|uniref:Glucans biosynthesis protein G n=2 Tax=Verticiella sediminum TaxID=1247510 RepID=A0A556AZ28_9BURK|nr:glucan biosynthesis protein G [Verticiella sediminum]
MPLRALALVFATFVASAACQAAEAFTYDDVVKRARELVDERYAAPPANPIPDILRNLKFGGYQEIQQKREFYLWNDSANAFQVKLNHPGMQFGTPVNVNIVDEQGVHEVKYDPTQFEFGKLEVDPANLQGLGVAGFRVLNAINSPDKPDDEIASFLGATYFRMIGRGQWYGASARGLAIDTALPSGEQFPRFTDFWILRPGVHDDAVTVYALLDAPAATGAFEFVIRPGEDTVADVQAQLFFRNQVGKLGIAPLTSMFLFGSNQPSPTPNFRPELHDSDGLAIRAGNGELIWRPLNNPRRLSVSSFAIEQPRGFGLMQRGRGFSRYEDIEDRYELRPSVWVEPVGDWGRGAVELVEIPTGDETNDNIVAFWVPEQQPEVGTPFKLQYRLYWTRNDIAFHDPNLGWVSQTRRSPGEVRGDDLVRRPDGTIAYRVDFRGTVLEDLDPATAVTAEVSSNGNAEIVENRVVRNPATRGYRLLLKIKPGDPAKPVELRAALKTGERTLSEVWSYQVPAQEAAANR